MTAAVSRRLTVRGIVRWVYDYGAAFGWNRAPGSCRPWPTSGRETAPHSHGQGAETIRRSAVAARLARAFPQLEVNSVADLVRISSSGWSTSASCPTSWARMSLIVTVLLISTLLTITVNERLGEIVTLRAIGISRATVVRQVFFEGAALTIVGSVLGIVLGLVTARYLDCILTSFPGFPLHSRSSFPGGRASAPRLVVLVATGSLAGLYPAWLACPRADRGHPASRGHVSGPVLRAGIFARTTP